MKLLHFIDTLDPRTGGPAECIRIVTPSLALAGAQTTILTTDAPDSPWPAPAGASVIPLGRRSGFIKRSPALESWLKENIKNYDAVILHALWQGFSPLVRKAALAAGRPYFLYSHGMLDPWFRRAYPIKHLKKWVYWQLIERAVVRDAAALLFTCEEERRLAATTFAPYACSERVVSFGTASAPGVRETQLAAWYATQPELANRPYLLFLGRLHPKKGVDLLLEAYLTLASETQSLPPLVLAGPADDPAYAAHLHVLAARLPAHAKVIFPGQLGGDVKWGAIRGAEAFVLVSHQENFGIAVAEALAAGTPVLLSNQVNIWREIVDDGAGFAASDSVAGALELLRRWGALSPSGREAMRRAAAVCHQKRFHVDAVARSLAATLAEFAPAFRAARL